MLQSENFVDLSTLGQTVPGLHIESHPRSGDLFIRGIGSGENQSFDQSVGTFIDDVYHGRARAISASLLDLDRVEVLRGPQSTYFGNNAIAGALNLVTRKPGGTPEARFRALYGDHDQYAMETAFGAPITERISVRGTAAADGSGGWLRNINTGRNEPRSNNLAGRLTARFNMMDGLDVTMKVEGGRNRRVGTTYTQLTRCPPAAPMPAAGFCAVALSLGTPTGIDTNSNAKKSGDGTSLSSAEYVATAKYSWSGRELTSISALYDYHFDINVDADLTPAPLLTANAPENYRQFSQELRLASAADTAFDYLAGVYFQSDDLMFAQDFNYFFLDSVIRSVPAFAGLTPYLPIANTAMYSQTEHSYAAFGSASVMPTRHSKLTAGLRSTWVRKSFDWQSFFGTATQPYGGIIQLPATAQPLANSLGIGSFGHLHGSRLDHAWLPSAKAEFTPTTHVMAYASYSRGFKAGGFNGADTTAVAANFPFEPEHVNAYEIGLKSEWPDESLLVNIDVYRSDYTALQVAVNTVNAAGNILSLVTNAASSRSEGAELELEWLVSRAVDVSVEADYCRARYIHYPQVTPTQSQIYRGQTSQDLSGRPTTFAPTWAGSLNATYHAYLPGSYRLESELRTFWSSSYFLDGTDDPIVAQGPYVRIDGRLSIQSASTRWAVDLLATNITNRNILTFAQAFPTSLGSVGIEKQRPRSIAAQVRLKW